MRPLVLLCLVAATSSASRAQDVDTALVDSVVASLRLDQLEPTITAGLRASALAMGTSGGAFPAALTVAISGLEGRVTGRVRAAIAADYRPDLLRTVLDQTRLASRARMDSAFNAARDPTRTAALLADLTALEQNPTAFPLADSASAVRFLRATGALQPPTEFQRQIMRAMFRRLPATTGMADMLRDQGTTLDAFVDETLRTTYAINVARAIQLMRLLQARFSPEEQAEVEEALAFAESDAGQYLQRVTTEPVQAETAAFMDEALQSILP